MPAPPDRPIYAVSELAETLRGLIETSLPRVWVQGEISNFSRPASGHWYFTLKDDQAQLRCAMFRNANLRAGRPPANGDAVLVRGQVSLYPARGDLQLICEHLEPAGEGMLLRAFEALKKKLTAEGLFEPALKRPLPAAPRGIGLITSATGAAVRDVLSTLQRRYPLGTVYLLPVQVQGEAAAPAIVRALAELPQRAPVDLILLVRGGGSLEDLWAFNEEPVARAIRACTVPVICGVGHETDTTIADLAADLRAPTPTAAAEQAAPDLANWRRQADQLAAAVQQQTQGRLREQARQLTELRQRIERVQPARRLRDAQQRLDEWLPRLYRRAAAVLAERCQQLAPLRARLHRSGPAMQLPALRERLRLSHAALPAAATRQLRRADERLARQAALLDAYSPLSVLGRGFALARTADGRIARDAAQLAPGDRLNLRLASGTVETEVRRSDPYPGKDSDR